MGLGAVQHVDQKTISSSWLQNIIGWFELGKIYMATHLRNREKEKTMDSENETEDGEYWDLFENANQDVCHNNNFPAPIVSMEK